jgi:hypothetical protein
MHRGGKQIALLMAWTCDLGHRNNITFAAEALMD